jgi:hypothetical protein
MSLPLSASAVRALASVRRWLRHTWLGRLSLPLDLRRILPGRRPRRVAPRQPGTGRLALETLEWRGAPGDMLSVMAGTFLLGELSPLALLSAPASAGDTDDAAGTLSLVSAGSAPAAAALAADDDLSDIQLVDLFGAWSRPSAPAVSEGSAAADQPAASRPGGVHAPVVDPGADGLVAGEGGRRGPERLRDLAGASGGGGGGPAHTPAFNLGAGGSPGTAPAGSVPSPMLPSQAAGMAQGVGNALAGALGGTNSPAQASHSSSVSSAAAATAGTQPASIGQNDLLTTGSGAQGTAGQASQGAGKAQMLATSPATPNFAAIEKNYGSAPLAYVPNVGQTATQVQFVAQGAGFGLFLTAGGNATYEVPVTPQAGASSSAAGEEDAFSM